MPSTGRCSRVYGRIVGRIHHLLSGYERTAFLVYDYADCVSDIREQYPLDRDDTKAIARESGIPHPVESDCLLAQTTDLLITIETAGEPITWARAVKPSLELKNPRTLAKLEIERRYWQKRRVDWRIVTELEIPEVVGQNL